MKVIFINMGGIVAGTCGKLCFILTILYGIEQTSADRVDLCIYLP